MKIIFESIGFAVLIAFTIFSVRWLLISANEQGRNNTHQKSKSTEYQYYKKACLNHVYYWSSHYRLAPAYNPDGTLQICEDGYEK